MRLSLYKGQLFGYISHAVKLAYCLGLQPERLIDISRRQESVVVELLLLLCMYVHESGSIYVQHPCPTQCNQPPRLLKHWSWTVALSDIVQVFRSEEDISHLDIIIIP